jgi:hypothetical protein
MGFLKLRAGELAAIAEVRRMPRGPRGFPRPACMTVDRTRGRDSNLCISKSGIHRDSQPGRAGLEVRRETGKE